MKVKNIKVLYFKKGPNINKLNNEVKNEKVR